MESGFIFNHDRCVNCKACIAACILENGWTVKPRSVYTFNSVRLLSLPVINISMACNHCDDAVCLRGCPSKALYRDENTGAVIVNEKKCLGCRYCQWNCPYDAPKYDDKRRVINKCHLCYEGLKEARIPACASACPTGALAYGELKNLPARSEFEWMPDEKLNPSLRLTGREYGNNPKVFPQELYMNEIQKSNGAKNSRKGLWILVMFTFMATLLVSSTIYSFFEGSFPVPIPFCTATIVAGLISFLHLGKISRAWRSIVNIRKSPLSREIAAYIVFSVTSCMALLLKSPDMLLIASLAGIVLLVAIDAVYIFADRRKKIILHGGQTFLTALLIISFLTREVTPFVFIAFLKLSASIYGMTYSTKDNLNFSMRFFRFAILLITGIMLISERYEINNTVVLIFLTGEMLDRILFYIDFEPQNINDLIYSDLIMSSNEKKGD
jgi:Fe-S-cluster-containing dehydrogenase component/DMSO reductase anchor subunit